MLRSQWLQTRQVNKITARLFHLKNMHLLSVLHNPAAPGAENSAPLLRTSTTRSPRPLPLPVRRGRPGVTGGARARRSRSMLRPLLLSSLWSSLLLWSYAEVPAGFHSPFFSAKAMASSLEEKDSSMLDKGSPLGVGGGGGEVKCTITESTLNFLEITSCNNYFQCNYFSFFFNQYNPSTTVSPVLNPLMSQRAPPPSG